MLNYDYRYVTHKGDGYHDRHLKPYWREDVNYTFRRYPRLSTATAIVWIGVIIGCAFGIWELLTQ